MTMTDTAAESPRSLLPGSALVHVNCLNIFSTSFECVTGIKEELVQGKHQMKAQNQSAATAEQLEKLDIADRDTMGAVPRGEVQEGGDRQRGNALDWENAQHSGVGALIEHMSLQ